MERKNKTNNLTIKAAAGSIFILLLSLAIFMIADTLISFHKIDSRIELRSIMTNYFIITLLLSSAMLLLSIYLIFIYLKDYLELKSRFTLGIILAIFSFMMFALSSNPLLHKILGIYGKQSLIFALIPLFFATLSLAILAWISSK